MDDGFCLKMAVPEMKKDNFNIEMNDDVLFILSNKMGV
jgi:HSP20 family molecular chaperone IbpA